MTSRYTDVSRSSSGPTTRTQSTSALQEQFINELTTQAQTVMKQLTDEFTQNLQAQSAQFLQGIVGSGGDGSDGIGGIGNFAQLLSTAGKLLVPAKTTVSSNETSRSRDVDQYFRLSQSQALAEAGATLSKGDKNS
jgi:hypothetical protein